VSVLDASAVLALLQKEPGGGVVASHLDGARISTVNASEVGSKLVDAGLTVGAARATLGALGIDLVDFDVTQAWAISSLRSRTRTSGLSLGDRACIALGLHLDAPVVTADRRWLDFADLVEVIVVR
jgi:PIN domain nuclease of toxin-antitoxin system